MKVFPEPVTPNKTCSLLLFFMPEISFFIASGWSPAGLKLVTVENLIPPSSFLPKIKECALTGFSMNYTPDGNYQTYENSSMVAYEMQMSFQELEPIYHDEYTSLDQDRDESIGF